MLTAFKPLPRYQIQSAALRSKARTLCRATGAVAQVKLSAPKSDEIGYAESLSCRDIGGSSVIVLDQPPEQGQICSIVLKGSTDQLLDDLERAVDDGVNTFKAGLLSLPLQTYGGWNGFDLNLNSLKTIWQPTERPYREICSEMHRARLGTSSATPWLISSASYFGYSQERDDTRFLCRSAPH